jgi:tyrosyl-DNA phosphodiesterase-1
VIDLTTGDEDEDEDARFQAELERAIAASQAETSRQSSRTATNVMASSDSRPNAPEASAFLSERAQLEKERRERQKRLRNEASFEGNRYGDDSDDDMAIVEPPTKRQVFLASLPEMCTDNSRARPTLSSAAPSTSADVQTIDQVFWDGEFRQTATKHADPRKDARPTFRITEVLGRVSFMYNFFPCI